MVATPRRRIRSTRGSSRSLGRMVVGPISIACSAVASAHHVMPTSVDSWHLVR